MMKTLEQIKQDVAKIQADIERLEKDNLFHAGVPKIGQEYFFVGNAGGVVRDHWADREVDHDRLAIGNIFFTRESAKIKVRQLKVIQRLRVLAKGFVPDWNNGNESKYLPYYNNGSRGRAVSTRFMHQYSFVPYFRTKEDVNFAMKKLGEELDALLLEPHAMR